MAKIIKMSEENINQMRMEFEALLRTGKFPDGKVNYTKSFTGIKRPCTVYFHEIAWLKMQSLIRECNKEVGWHGIAYRGEDPNIDEYVITDILVYPQEVTGVTVTTDQIKYQTWLMGHEDDIFNNIRMQGHSHVNMGVTPSTTDEALYESILSQLDDTMFYIFMIYNKRGEYTYKIYDLAKNIMFDTSDVEVKVYEDEIGIEKFLKEAQEMVKEHTTVPPAGTYQGYQYPYYSSQYQKPSTQSTTPAVTQFPKKEDKKQEKEPEKKQKKYKRASMGKAAKHASSSFQNIDDYYDDFDDDIDSPYGPYGWRDGFYR